MFHGMQSSLVQALSRYLPIKTESDTDTAIEEVLGDWEEVSGKEDELETRIGDSPESDDDKQVVISEVENESSDEPKDTDANQTRVSETVNDHSEVRNGDHLAISVADIKAQNKIGKSIIC